MAEQIKHSPESHNHSHEHSREHQEHKKRLEKERDNRESEVQTVDTEALRAQIDIHAASSNETKPKETESAAAPSFAAYSDLKQQTYQRTLGHIRQRLSKSERGLSKVAHQPVVDSVSAGVGKTAARPSGILGGGIVAFIGSVVILYMAKKYGFEYNFFIFFVLLAIGFMIGVIAELGIYSIRKVRR